MSLGSASDVVVALRCTVGGPRVRFAIERGVIPPRWLAPTVSYANIDSADNGVIRLEAARVTGDLGLECELNGSGNNRADVTVNFNQGKLHLYQCLSTHTHARTHTICGYSADHRHTCTVC